MIRELAVKVSRSRASLIVAACLASLFLLVGASSYSSAVQQLDTTSPSQLSVMTRNIYFGTDPTPVLLEPLCSQFPQAATDAYQAALDSNFPLRAAAIAEEIRQTGPDLVGIQEGVIWTELWDGGQTVDFVQMILDALSSLGLDYTPLVVAAGADVEFPTTLAGPVRLQVNDVLLARTDAALTVSNVQWGTYASRLVLPTCIGTVSIPRQWAAVTVEVGQQTVRVITTHLEAALEYIRVQQAQELLAGPAATDLPAILMGDFNAETGTEGDAAALIMAAGYADTWPSPGSGPTCCQAADLRNTTSQLDERIDLIFERGGLRADGATLVGDQMLATPPGSVVWASDHAGVSTSLSPWQGTYLPLLVQAAAGE